MRSLLMLAAFGAGLNATPLSAQGCERTPVYADEYLGIAAQIFVDPELYDSRGTEIELVDPADPHYVVRADSVCAAVLAVVIPDIQARSQDWASGAVGMYTAAIYRIGPYYFVRLGAEDRNPPGEIRSAPSPDVVLRASDLAVVKRFNY